MKIVADNRVVSLSYTLRDEHESILESRDSAAPYQYLHGYGHLVPGLERALDGMQTGESFDVYVPPEQAYGHHEKAYVYKVPREQLPPDTPLEVGAPLEFTIDGPDQALVVFIKAISDRSITLDANHPLAGKTLRFTGRIIDVREASSEEIAQRRPNAEPLSP